MSRVSAEVAYYRRAQGHFTATDNLDVASGDFQSYCVTAPADSHLPNGGGQEICGLYDISAAKFGLASNNLVTFVDNYGKQSEVFNGVDIAMNARLRAGVFLSGGFATGNTHFASCDAFVDNPKTAFGLTAATNTFSYCDYDSGWLSQAKLTGSYTLPWQQIQLGW